MRRRGNDYEGALSLVVMFLLLMFALPIIGFTQVCKGEAWSRILDLDCSSRLILPTEASRGDHHG